MNRGDGDGVLCTFHVSLLVRQARPIRYHHLANLIPRGHLGVTVIVLAAIHIVNRRPPLYLLDESLGIEHAHKILEILFRSLFDLEMIGLYFEISWRESTLINGNELGRIQKIIDESQSTTKEERSRGRRIERLVFLGRKEFRKNSPER